MTTGDLNERLAFKAEIRSYFGLTQAQVDEMETSWNAFYLQQSKITCDNIPVQKQF